MPVKKYLGQNFLQNKRKLKRIAAALDASVPLVIEIGPGHGDLTQVLLDAGFMVYAIEKDPDMVCFLQKKFSEEISHKKLTVVEGDALKEFFHFSLYGAHSTGAQIFVSKKCPYLVVGNIPYYITGQLFRVLEGLVHKPKQTVLLVQKEVADRACAREGAMNLLAASLGWWAHVRLVTRVPRAMFNPPPKVDGAAIELRTKSEKQTSNVSRDAYFTCVRALFKQPRKTIMKNLVDAGIERGRVERELQSLGLPLVARPHQLSIDHIQKISAELF